MAIDLQHKTARIIIFCALLLPFPAAAATVQLPRTGQTACYDASGSVIACTGTGQDGDKLKGAAMPSSRFTDNANGTVTDNLTGLVWLKNANCWGEITWQTALTNSNTLASGACGLTDGSAVGDWRMPNIAELESLVDLSRNSPAISVGHPFNNVQPNIYWASNSDVSSTSYAWGLDMITGFVRGGQEVQEPSCQGCSSILGNKLNSVFVLPVRGGQ